MDNNQIIDLYNMETIKVLYEKKSTIVYLARNNKTNEEYVAKIYKKKILTKEEIISFAQEVISYSKIINPAFLSLSHFSLPNSKYPYPIIVTQYKKNESLDQILEKIRSGTQIRDFTLTQRYKILLSIILCMSYLNMQGVYHSDLKPSNILVDSDFSVYISNFFFSNYSNDLKSADFFYTAPEIILNQNRCKKSDTYSFALIFYELLTERFPYNSQQTYDQFSIEIKNSKRPDFNIIRDIRIRNFLKGCMSDNPEDRPNFDTILEEIMKENYLKAFRITKSDVKQFIIDYKIKEKSAFIDTDPKRPIPRQNYLIRRGVEKSTLEYKISADNGEADSMFEYALRLQKGSGVAKNDLEAARYYKMAADKGHTSSMFNYAIMHYNGEGVEVDKKKAAQYFKRAADGGEITAMLNYAFMCHDGSGIPVDNKRAARYFKMAADRGNPRAMLNYGILLQNGEGVVSNKKEAARYFKMASDNNETMGMLNYAVMLREGDGIKKDVNEAARYYKMAADLGNYKAMSEYGVLLLRGEGIERKPEAAYRFFKIAADHGEANAMFNYGIMQLNGDNEEKAPNKEKALHYYREAADRGHSNAMFNLAMLIIENEGLAPIEEAIKYLNMAIEKKNYHAFLQMGMMLMEGSDIEKDVTKGVKMIRTAAENGIPEAMEKYADLLQYGRGVEMNKKKAAHLFKLAADQGQINAMMKYSHMLLSGDGIAKNQELSDYYFKMANIAFNAGPRKYYE